MIEHRFKGCCYTCNNPDPDYQQVSGLGEMVTVFGCSHSHVCGRYLAEQEEPAAEDVKIKGFCHADG